MLKILSFIRTYGKIFFSGKLSIIHYRTYLIFMPVTQITKGFDEIKAFILKSLLYNHYKKDTKWTLYELY
jgi:hypothetical protein